MANVGIFISEAADSEQKADTAEFDAAVGSELRNTPSTATQAARWDVAKQVSKKSDE